MIKIGNNISEFSVYSCQPKTKKELIDTLHEKMWELYDDFDVEEETYYATLFLTKDGETLEIDARPSDAIAVAMRAEAPIFVTANVLMNGSVSTDTAKDEEEAQEFKDFIQNIKPSDFEKLMEGKHKENDQ